MSPMQQIFLGVGGAKKTYMEDVFSIYLYDGTGGAQSINNGIDFDGEGGAVWCKSRNQGYNHMITDTVRGVGKTVGPNMTNAELSGGPYAQRVTAFNSNGFTLGTDNGINDASGDYVSWNFRKAPGFFDVVTYTGSGSTQNISHSLGSVPGLILIKNLTDSAHWSVYHRDVGNEKILLLNDSQAAATSSNYWNDTSPTATQFTVNSSSSSNANSKNYVAYIFAGGESTASEAVSVDFDGSGDWMNTPATSDFAFGTGDFTIECWVKNDNENNNGGFFNIDTGTGIGATDGIAAAWNGSIWVMYAGNVSGQYTAPSAYKMNESEWYHVAYVRHSNTTTLYVNGTAVVSATDSTNYSANRALAVGAYANSSNYSFNGKISNLRVVKGTAVYTSSFRPPTEPLANISGTTMLCCNNSSTTGKTVGPSLTAWGTVTAKTDSPFDDPAAFNFGDNKEGIIKCGSYLGSSSSSNEIFLGFEPQWVMIKRSTSAESWAIVDSMRGIVTGENDARLQADSNGTEAQLDDRIDLTSTGFKLTSSNAEYNGSGTYVYCAIRRPDGYVGKLKTATELFALDTGNSSSTGPAFDSNFAVDFAIMKQPAAVLDWRVFSRLTAERNLATDTTSAEGAETNNTTDYNDGIGKNYTDVWFAAMWKRHKGFDVVTYAGVPSTYSATGVGSISVPHNLNAVPEMIWVKNRTYGDNNGWAVYHKGLNGGTNPEQYRIRLQDTNANDDNVGAWQDTAPTSTHFTLGTDRMVNQATFNYLAMLFSSVPNISKVGYYTGTGNALSVTTGFQPRFYMIKRADGTGDWFVMDSLRGISNSGDEKLLRLNSSVAQVSDNIGNTSSTGFTITSTSASFNANGGKYIYYAHA